MRPEVEAFPPPPGSPRKPRGIVLAVAAAAILGVGLIAVALDDEPAPAPAPAAAGVAPDEASDAVVEEVAVCIDAELGTTLTTSAQRGLKEGMRALKAFDVSTAAAEVGQVGEDWQRLTDDVLYVDPEMAAVGQMAADSFTDASTELSLAALEVIAGRFSAAAKHVDKASVSMLDANDAVTESTRLLETTALEGC